MPYLKELNLAKEAAFKAAEKINETLRSEVLNHEGRDVKHAADINAEKAILETLKKGSDFAIIAEESGTSGVSLEDQPYWVVDPLDGTVNFTRDIPLYCISIALWCNNEPLLGVIYDFNRDELFSGICGQGAWLNDSEINSAGRKEKNESILATGFPVNRDFSDSHLLDFVKDIQDYKKIRLFGSAALSLAYVACGRVDAYFEEGIMFWDVAAGVAIAQAAGAEVEILWDETLKLIKVEVC